MALEQANRIATPGGPSDAVLTAALRPAHSPPLAFCSLPSALPPPAVMALEQVSASAALDERRLRLRLDSYGVVTEVTGDPPAGLFGFEPRLLRGASIASFVDALRPCPGGCRFQGVWFMA
jgi:hypothetical protein